MAGFMIRFLISNLFISGMIGILFAAKRLLKNSPMILKLNLVVIAIRADSHQFYRQ